MCNGTARQICLATTCSCFASHCHCQSLHCAAVQECTGVGLWPATNSMPPLRRATQKQLLLLAPLHLRCSDLDIWPTMLMHGMQVWGLSFTPLACVWTATRSIWRMRGGSCKGTTPLPIPEDSSKLANSRYHTPSPPRPPPPHCCSGLPHNCVCTGLVIFAPCIS